LLGLLVLFVIFQLLTGLSEVPLNYKLRTGFEKIQLVPINVAEPTEGEATTLTVEDLVLLRRGFDLHGELAAETAFKAVQTEHGLLVDAFGQLTTNPASQVGSDIH
jgi:hypothetical protein